MNVSTILSLIVNKLIVISWILSGKRTQGYLDTFCTLVAVILVLQNELLELKTLIKNWLMLSMRTCISSYGCT